MFRTSRASRLYSKDFIKINCSLCGAQESECILLWSVRELNRRRRWAGMEQRSWKEHRIQDGCDQPRQHYTDRSDIGLLSPQIISS